MLRSVEHLLENHSDKTIGNHMSVHLNTSNIVKYFYFSTAICVVNHNKRQYYTDNGGWNTSSTNRAIHSYKQNFDNLGYEKVSKNQDW